MKIKNKASFEAKFKGMKLISAWQVIKYLALILGLFLVILQTYAYFMQGDNLSTWYSYSRIQHSENFMYAGAAMFFLGAFMYLVDEYKKEFFKTK